MVGCPASRSDPAGEAGLQSSNPIPNVQKQAIVAGRETVMLLTAGERISMALLAMAIKSLGQEARFYTGSQAGLSTDARHGSRQQLIEN